MEIGGGGATDGYCSNCCCLCDCCYCLVHSTDEVALWSPRPVVVAPPPPPAVVAADGDAAQGPRLSILASAFEFVFRPYALPGALQLHKQLSHKFL